MSTINEPSPQGETNPADEGLEQTPGLQLGNDVALDSVIGDLALQLEGPGGEGEGDEAVEGEHQQQTTIDELNDDTRYDFVPSPCVWVGSIPNSVDEETIKNLFSPYGEIVHIRYFQQSKCAFVTFRKTSQAKASLVLEGREVGDTGEHITLNIGKASRHLWIGNITESVTEVKLKHSFEEFGVIESVRILRKNNCGFVNFVSAMDAVRAAEALNGKDMNGQKIVVNFQWNESIRRTTKKGTDLRAKERMQNEVRRRFEEPSRQLFVGNLVPSVTQSTLWALFMKFGQVESIRAFIHRGYAFVTYSDINASVWVRNQMSAYPPTLGNRRLVVNFGQQPVDVRARNRNNQHSQQHTGQPQQARAVRPGYQYQQQNQHHQQTAQNSQYYRTAPPQMDYKQQGLYDVSASSQQAQQQVPQSYQPTYQPQQPAVPAQYVTAQQQPQYVQQFSPQMVPLQPDFPLMEPLLQAPSPQLAPLNMSPQQVMYYSAQQPYALNLPPMQVQSTGKQQPMYAQQYQYAPYQQQVVQQPQVQQTQPQLVGDLPSMTVADQLAQLSSGQPQAQQQAQQQQQQQQQPEEPEAK